MDRPGKNLVIFRDETEIPIQKGGINLYAPGYECTFGFDPAFDMLSASPTLNEASRSFCEALVTDGDILNSRDPFWAFNARNLLSALFIGGVFFWKSIHKRAGEFLPSDLPSLTDVILGMVDDMASARMKKGESTSRVSASLPGWWNLVPEEERDILRAIMLDAPLNTAGSLIAVVNSFTGGLSAFYSSGKCDLLFDPDTEENIFAFLPALNAATLNVLLRTARAAWGKNLRLAACGVSSWPRRSLDVLGSFWSETFSGDDGFLLLASNPHKELVSWYSGDCAWGNALTASASSFFRKSVEETTGNPDGRLTALSVEAPELCDDYSFLRLSEEGWSLGSIKEELVDEMQGRGHVLLRPADCGQSEEIRSLRAIFEGRQGPVFSYQNGEETFVVHPHSEENGSEEEPFDELGFFGIIEELERERDVSLSYPGDCPDSQEKDEKGERQPGDTEDETSET